MESVSSSSSNQLSTDAAEPVLKKSSYGSPGDPVSSTRTTFRPPRSRGFTSDSSSASTKRDFEPECLRIYPISSVPSRVLMETRMPPAAGTPKSASSIGGHFGQKKAKRWCFCNPPQASPAPHPLNLPPHGRE